MKKRVLHKNKFVIIIIQRKFCRFVSFSFFVAAAAAAAFRTHSPSNYNIVSFWFYFYFPAKYFLNGQ